MPLDFIALIVFTIDDPEVIIGSDIITIFPAVPHGGNRIFYYDKEHVWMVRTAHLREREKLKAENLIWGKKEE